MMGVQKIRKSSKVGVQEICPGNLQFFTGLVTEAFPATVHIHVKGIPTMADYPTLKEMGITRFDEISHYSLRQEGPARDALKIYYQRQKGSLLPISRKYKFGRSTNTVRTGSGDSGVEEVHEISPFLQKALAELDALVEQRESALDDKEQLLAEIDHLERTVLLKFEDIKARVEQMK